MKSHIRLIAVLALVLFSLTLSGALLARERGEIEPQFTWDLTALYASPVAFNEAKNGFLPQAEKLNAYKGRLGESPATLKAALDMMYGLEKELRRMEAYAHKTLDQDTRVADNKARQQETETLLARWSELTAWGDPEIVALGKDKVDALSADASLKEYRYPLSETLRKQKHILPPEQEAILAAAGDTHGTPYNAYTLFTNADLPFETITLADGSLVKVDYANFDKIRRGLVESDRRAVFASYMGLHDQFKRTIGEMLYGQMKIHAFYAKQRGYANTLEAALDNDGIDPQIYRSLIQAAHDNLPIFHRYLKLKARALGKDKLVYTDLYMPFTRDVNIEMNYADAQKTLLTAFAPLGQEYVNTIGEAFNNRWIDVYPNEGKDNGAYASGWAYDVHPYVLMNYTDTYNEALTLAHELGHAMHSYNSNKTQPFATADYSTFVAEVASTFNENLLNDTMLKKVKDEDERLFLLGNFLDGTIKGTFFRQIQFAEFELIIHEKVEQGEPLTGEMLNGIFMGLVKKYYGVDEGVTEVPDYLAAEWAIVPHFYYNFYVFQYSTSVAAASLLSEDVLAKKKGALERYTGMLKAGASKNPVEILQDAGADMTQPDAYKALMKRANLYMDEVEKILAKRGL